MNFSSILTKFGQDIGVGPVALDERDSCYLRFDQSTIALEHLPAQNILYIYTSFAHYFTNSIETYFEHLLTCNHFNQGSGNGWFSYNRETQEILLMTKLSSEKLEYDDFVLHLEAFLNSIDHAKNFIQELQMEKSGPLHQKLHLKNPFA